MSGPTTRQAVATAHPWATAIGHTVLATGGNAYDAALAVSAALPVVLPHTNGLGADLFAVVYDRVVETINGSGPAAALAAPEVFERAGFDEVPDRGPLAAFTVPGLVASWMVLSKRCTRPFRDLLQPAIRIARQGTPRTPQLSLAIDRMPWGDEEWLRIYRGGPAQGRLLQTEMGRTLEDIAADGGHGFYHGALGRRIEQDMVRKGGLLRFDDLDRYEATQPPALRIRYRGHDVYTTPPNSQGATALYWLARLGKKDLSALSAEAYTRSLIEEMYPAYAFRAQCIGDPRLRPLPSDWLTAPVPAHPDSPASARGGRDTTAFSVFDGDVGLSVIQSNWEGFGSGFCVTGTGINLTNRGACFTLDRRNPNVVAPGKKPFHTLMATVATGPSTILLGSMGGDVQPQVHVQVLTRLLDRGERLQPAIAAPRFAYPASIYAPAPVFAEEGLGLSPSPTPPPSPGLVGHCQGIAVGADVEAGIDPRGEGLLVLPGWP